MSFQFHSHWISALDPILAHSNGQKLRLLKIQQRQRKLQFNILINITLDLVFSIKAFTTNETR